MASPLTPTILAFDVEVQNGYVGLGALDRPIEKVEALDLLDQLVVHELDQQSVRTLQAEPIVEQAEPIVEQAEPIVEQAEPIVEQAEPIVEQRVDESPLRHWSLVTRRPAHGHRIPMTEMVGERVEKGARGPPPSHISHHAGGLPPLLRGRRRREHTRCQKTGETFAARPNRPMPLRFRSFAFR